MVALWGRRIKVVAARHAVRPALHDAILKRIDFFQNVNDVKADQSKQQKEDDRSQSATTAARFILLATC